MDLPSYKDVLSMGKEALKEVMIPVRVNKARKQAELEMCKLDEDLAVKAASLQDICSGENVNFAKIISLQDELALLNRKKEQYQQILDQMFPLDGE